MIGVVWIKQGSVVAVFRRTFSILSICLSVSSCQKLQLIGIKWGQLNRINMNLVFVMRMSQK